jgi:hypothetical protein
MSVGGKGRAENGVVSGLFESENRLLGKIGRG